MKHSSSKMASKSSIRRERLQRMAEVVQDAAYACSFRTWLPKWQKFDISQSSEAVQFFDDHGWVIFRNVFDALQNVHSSVLTVRVGRPSIKRSAVKPVPCPFRRR